MDYPFDPKMGEAIGGDHGPSEGLLLGRRTFEMFAPAWSGRTAEDDPGAPFMNESPKYVVSGDARERRLEQLDDPRAVRRRTRSAISRSGVDGDLYVSGSGTLVRAHARRRSGRRAAPVRLSR